MTDQVSELVAEPAKPLPLEIGERLRRKRETLGMRLEDVAKQLRVDVRHLDALERDDTEAMPSAVFAKGYLRNYARHLELDPDPLLAAFDAAVGLQPPPLARLSKVSMGSRWMGEFPWERVLLLGGLVVIALGLAWIGNTVYGLFRSAAEENALVLAPGGDSAEIFPITLGTPPAPPPAEGDNGALSLALPARPSSVESQTAPDDGASEPQITDTPVEMDDPAELEAAPLPEVATVTLNFTEDSWVELVDAQNKRLLSRVGKAGQSLTVSGIPPIDVVLGNAPGVALEYNGEQIAPKRPRRGQVAKFRLGDG